MQTQSPPVALRPMRGRDEGTKKNRPPVQSASVIRKVLIAAITGALPDEYRDEAIDLLTEAMHGQDDEVRALAVIALQEIGCSAPAVLPALIDGLRDPHEIVRRRSARALGDFGMAATPALPHLVRILDDNHNCVRMEAISALARLGSEAESALPFLVPLLADPEMRLSTVAGVAIRRIGNGAISHLIEALSDPNAVLRERAAALLGHLGKPSDLVIEALLESCTDSEPEVREAARSALDRLCPIEVM